MDNESNGNNTVPPNSDTDRKSDSNSDSGQEGFKELKVSGRWSDIEAPMDFGKDELDDAFEGRRYTPPSPLYSPYRTPSPKTVSPAAAFDDPKYEAPVLWIRRTFGLTVETLKEAILKAFEESEVKDVEIVGLYVSTGESRDHAYLVLNSENATKLILDGTISVVIQKDSGTGESEEISLWIDNADHLAPTEEQDPYTLYVWQLPKDRPAKQVEKELVNLILPLSPIKEIQLPADANGFSVGWAELTFKFERDTQKCIYMLNYNYFMGVQIRAAFFQTNRPPRKPIAAPAPRRSPPARHHQNARKSPNHLSTSPIRMPDRSRKVDVADDRTKTGRQRSPPEKPKSMASLDNHSRGNNRRGGEVKTIPAKENHTTIGWEVIGREGRDH